MRVMRKRAPECIPAYSYYGPERPLYPGGDDRYTAERVVYRGYTLRQDNAWSRRLSSWRCLETALSVVGPGSDPWPWAVDWRARVAGVEAAGATMLEALEEAWAGAEFEDQLEHLAPAGVEAKP